MHTLLQPSPPARRRFVAGAGLLLAGFALGAGGACRAQDALPPELRIGFQKSSVNLTLLKQRKALERRLKGIQVGWFEFTAGPQQNQRRGAVKRIRNP